ncbi:hypothetical protein GCM10020000_78010 [Streptomyces olivoverticillatus]
MSWPASAARPRASSTAELCPIADPIGLTNSRRTRSDNTRQASTSTVEAQPAQLRDSAANALTRPRGSRISLLMVFCGGGAATLLTWHGGLLTYARHRTKATARLDVPLSR